ncbi:MAG: helix-turn-helix transcriptional regulator, partial [Prevotellaceae bacterium]|nr:helix-turn-helix transcriptional regulator [Candidatus Faecinaster equi]
MINRIKQIMDYSQLSQKDSANTLGISESSLSSIFNGRTRPTNNHTQAIHKAYP